MTTTIETEWYSLAFNADTGTSVLQFLKRPDSENYRTAYAQLKDLFIKEGLTKHITNTTHLGVIAVEDQNFVGTQIIPSMREQLDELKVMHIGVVKGKDVFATFAAKNIGKQMRTKTSGIESTYFSSLDEALAAFAKLP